MSIWIEIPAAIGDQLDALTAGQRRGLRARQDAFEQAVHAALDAEHWPRGPRGTVAIACAYWYVNLRRRGELVGHVGPLPSKADAEQVARSWRDAGCRGAVSRTALGRCLTNRFEDA